MAAINLTFNSILNEIQMSKLNFLVNLTPYAAYIVLKKSTQVDKYGNLSDPSPPLITLYQQSTMDLSAAQVKISSLTTSLRDAHQRHVELETTNAALLVKIQTLDKDLTSTNRINNDLHEKLSSKDNQITTLNQIKLDLETQLKLQEKKYSDQVQETDTQIQALGKVKKSQQKEVYNLERKITHFQDTICNLKEDKRNLENDVKRLNKKIKKLEPKKVNLMSISCQTYNSVDVPYSIMKELPPIFGSHIYVKPKPAFISNSLPDLSTPILIEDNDEELIREAAKEALMVQYDEEVKWFYNETKKCKVCGLDFKSRAELEDHDKNYPFSCEECSTCYATYREVDHHCQVAGHYKEE